MLIPGKLYGIRKSYLKKLRHPYFAEHCLPEKIFRGGVEITKNDILLFVEQRESLSNLKNPTRCGPVLVFLFGETLVQTQVDESRINEIFYKIPANTL